MALLQEWRDYAYKFDDRTAEGQQFWLNYFNIEKGIYEQLLADKDTVVSGTVKKISRQIRDRITDVRRILRWNQRQLKKKQTQSKRWMKIHR